MVISHHPPPPRDAVCGNQNQPPMPVAMQFSSHIKANHFKAKAGQQHFKANAISNHFKAFPPFGYLASSPLPSPPPPSAVCRGVAITAAWLSLPTTPPSPPQCAGVWLLLLLGSLSGYLSASPSLPPSAVCRGVDLPAVCREPTHHYCCHAIFKPLKSKPLLVSAPPPPPLGSVPGSGPPTHYYIQFLCIK